MKQHKIYLSLLFVSLTLPLFLKAQVLDKVTLECQYKLIWVPDTLSPGRTNEDFLILKSGAKVSEFYSYNTYRADSAMHADIKRGMSAIEILGKRAQYGKRGMGYHIFNNYPKGKITVTEKLVSDNYKYEEPLLQQKWIIQKEKTTILGYLAQKATCTFAGRKYVAWFTSEIPLSLGPWKFNGLPGLILKVEDVGRNYKFEIVGLRKINTGELLKIDTQGHIEVSKHNFLNLERKFRKDPVAFINSNTAIKVEPVGNNQIKYRPYNPIER